MPLQVLDRTVKFMQRSLPPQTRLRLLWTQKAVIAIVIAFNALGLAAHFAAAYYLSQSVTLHYQIADLLDSHRRDEVAAVGVASAAAYDRAAQGISIQLCCEVIVSFIIIASFCVVLPTCFQVLRNAKKMAHELGTRASAVKNHRESAAIALVLKEVASEGQSLKRRLIFTVISVFLTFLLRAAFAIINAMGALPPKSASILPPNHRLFQHTH